MSSTNEIDQNAFIKPDKKKAKIDTSKWPLLMKVNKIKINFIFK
jgi:hypothetical protein